MNKFSSKLGSELTQDGGSFSFKMSKREWTQIGETAGWLKESQFREKVREDEGSFQETGRDDKYLFEDEDPEFIKTPMLDTLKTAIDNMNLAQVQDLTNTILADDLGPEITKAHIKEIFERARDTGNREIAMTVKSWAKDIVSSM